VTYHGDLFPCIFDKAEPTKSQSGPFFCTGKLSICIATRGHQPHVIHPLLVLAHRGSERDDATARDWWRETFQTFPMLSPWTRQTGTSGFSHMPESCIQQRSGPLHCHGYGTEDRTTEKKGSEDLDVGLISSKTPAAPCRGWWGWAGGRRSDGSEV
jgi:hypothetical protein